MLHEDENTIENKRRQTITGMVTQAADVERILGWKRSDRKTSIDAMYDMLSTDLRQDIGKIGSPTLVLGTWIAYKNFAPKVAIENTFHMQYARLPNVKIEIADHARHFIMYDDPQWMLERMDAFLQ
jgi:pimeloyl-ACP methyl ester carboxylesterase